MIILNEFADVKAELDSRANGPRLKIEDLETGTTTYLDPLELQSLVWVRHKGLAPFLDPSSYRWQEEGPVFDGGHR
jgi:hypothetical protein